MLNNENLIIRKKIFLYLLCCLYFLIKDKIAFVFFTIEKMQVYTECQLHPCLSADSIVEQLMNV